MRHVFVLLLGMLAFNAGAMAAPDENQLAADTELAYCRNGICTLVHTPYTWADTEVQAKGIFVLTFTKDGYTEADMKAAAGELNRYWGEQMRSHGDQCLSDYFSPMYKKLIECVTDGIKPLP